MNETLEERIALYEPIREVVDLVRDSKIVLLVGITAAGKGTVIQELKETGKYHELVSHTTREMRSNNGNPEQDGVEYHFIDVQTAEHMVEQKAFVEVKYVHGNIYGTSRAELDQAKDEGKIVLCDVDIKGAEEYHHLNPDTVTIFLLPPNFNVWKKRLEARDKKLPDDVRLSRFKTAVFELETVLARDYFQFVINDDLSRVVEVVNSLADGKASETKNERARAIARTLLNDIKNTEDLVQD